MDNKFKWDMFVTSFIPLWISIIVIDVWEMVEYSVVNWDRTHNAFENINILLRSNALLITSVIIITVFVINSIKSIRAFLNDRNAKPNKSKGTIIAARRANKLSSEFLLAYILPMIAFDFSNIKNVVLFVIYFIVLAILCIKNNNVYTNVYLEFLGYKIYDCDIRCKVMGKDHDYLNSLIISPVDLTLEKDNEVPYWDFEKYIYIVLCDVEGKNE